MIAALLVLAESWINPALGLGQADIAAMFHPSEQADFVGRPPLELVDVWGEPSTVIRVRSTRAEPLSRREILSGLGLDANACSVKLFPTPSADLAVGEKTPGLKPGWKMFFDTGEATLVGPPLADDFSLTQSPVSESTAAAQVKKLMTSGTWNSAVKALGRAQCLQTIEDGDYLASWRGGGRLDSVTLGITFASAKSEMPAMKDEKKLVQQLYLNFRLNKVKSWRESLVLAGFSSQGAKSTRIDEMTQKITGVKGLPAGWDVYVLGQSSVMWIRFAVVSSEPA